MSVRPQHRNSFSPIAAPRLSRRDWLARGGLSSAGALALPWLLLNKTVRGAEATSTAEPAAPGFEVAEVTAISHLSAYHGWPTVARRKSGELLLVYSGGREAHVCPFGRVELMRSHDDGKTWTYPQVILDSPIDDRDAGVLETDRGTILVTTFTSLAYEPILKRAEAAAGTPGAWPDEKLRRWQAAHERVDAEGRDAALDVWITRSTDDGITWSQRQRCIVSSPHGPIQLRDGRLLYAGKELWKGRGRVGVCQSSDDGATWEWLAEIPTRQGDDPAQYHEFHAVETADGRLIAQIRNHNPQNAGETLQCESDDGGKTWSAPRSIGVWGLPSHLLRLRDGRILMTYGYRRPPFGCQSRISEDGGRSWSAPMVLYGDGAGGDLGYPSTVELGDGTLLTVWYELLAGSSQAVLRQARWRWT
ncbi:MAG: hypothetical protein Kow0040_31640 [Thermogutta sp.]